MNNYQWLLKMDGADRKAWFDAEHVEHQERALDGDTDAQNGDSRELILTDLEKKTREWHDYDGNYMRIYSNVAYAQMKELLDRQAAITEREVEHDLMKAGRMAVEVERERIAELTAERDELKGQVFTLKSECDDLENDLHRLTAERDELQMQVDELKAERVKLRSQICKLEDDLVGTSDERDNWKANCEDWKNHARAAENACYETMLEREDYRNKFGKCLDYADAIHALMDDEGMA